MQRKLHQLGQKNVDISNEKFIAEQSPVTEDKYRIE